MARLFACFLLILVAMPAAAVRLQTVGGAARVRATSWAPLGERTVVLAGGLRLVDWSRSEGFRDTLLTIDDFNGQKAHAWRDTVFVGGENGRWHRVYENFTGHVEWDRMPDFWRPANTVIDGTPYFIHPTHSGAQIYNVGLAEEPIGSVHFDFWTPASPVCGGDRAVAFHWYPGDDHALVQVADFSDPAAPVLGPVIEIEGPVTGAVIRGRALLLVGDLLRSFDLDDVTSLVQLDLLGPIAEFREPYLRDDGMLAVWHGYSLRLYDCSDPTDLRGGPSAPEVLDYEQHRGPIALDEHRIVTAVNEGPWQFLLPGAHGGITDGGVAWWRLKGVRMATDGRHAWVQGERRHVCDLHHAGRLLSSLPSEFPDDDGAVFLAHHRDHLIVAPGDGGLRIEDVSEPTAQVIVAELPLTGITAVALGGDVLAVAAGQTLHLYDVTDPAAPQARGTLALAQPCSRVGLDGERPFLVESGSGIDDRVLLLDLADLAHPLVAATVDLDDGDPDVLQGIDAHVLHGTDLLLRALLVRDGYAVSSVTWRLDLADPWLPAVETFSNCVEFWGDVGLDASPLACAIGSYHIVTSSLGLHVLVYAGSPHVQPVASRHFDEPVRDLHLAGSLLTVLLEDRIVTMTLVDHDPVAAPDPAGRAGVTIAPNPFNPRATVAFTMTRAGGATVQIHDLRGRRVRTLVAELPAGPARLTWNGTDDDGGALPSGTYLVRVVAPETVLTTRCCLIR